VIQMVKNNLRIGLLIGLSNILKALQTIIGPKGFFIK
jgi:hypothetical protein